jgi:hypothetical protein
MILLVERRNTTRPRGAMDNASYYESRLLLKTCITRWIEENLIYVTIMTDFDTFFNRWKYMYMSDIGDEIERVQVDMKSWNWILTSK